MNTGVRQYDERTLEPEWLDHLAAGDPRAVRARHDLKLVNRIMGHARIIAKVLRTANLPQAPRIAELGAGDGTLVFRIAQAMSWPHGTHVVLVDRKPAVNTDTQVRYRSRGCDVTVDAADVFDWLSRESKRFDAVVANLFLHHFEGKALARLFALAVARTNVFVACEPRRAPLALAGSRMLGLLGCNDVTRHDAVLSVRAGFTGRELSALWPADANWKLEEGRAGLFSHLFIAEKRGLSPII